MPTAEESNGLAYAVPESIDSDAQAAPHSYSPVDLTDYLCDLRHRIPGPASQRCTSVNALFVMK